MMMGNASVYYIYIMYLCIVYFVHGYRYSYMWKISICGIIMNDLCLQKNRHVPGIILYQLEWIQGNELGVHLSKIVFWPATGWFHHSNLDLWIYTSQFKATVNGNIGMRDVTTNNSMGPNRQNCKIIQKLRVNKS